MNPAHRDVQQPEGDAVRRVDNFNNGRDAGQTTMMHALWRMNYNGTTLRCADSRGSLSADNNPSSRQSNAGTTTGMGAIETKNR